MGTSCRTFWRCMPRVTSVRPHRARDLLSHPRAPRSWPKPILIHLRDGSVDRVALDFHAWILRRFQVSASEDLHHRIVSRVLPTFPQSYPLQPIRPEAAVSSSIHTQVDGICRPGNTKGGTSNRLPDYA